MIPPDDEADAHGELLALTRAVCDQLRWQQDRGGRGVQGVLPPRPSKATKPAASRAPVPVPVTGPGLAPAPAPRPAPIATTPTVTVTTFGAAGLQQLRADLGDCTRCQLAGGRQQIVFGAGSPDAALMFVGEAPGAEEDRTGEPFVGAAGQLLTKMIEAMGFAREQVYIANIIKCRPPGNRNPEPDEIQSCEPFLKQQIATIRPRVLVCLGKFAAHTLLRTDAPISRLRGGWASYEGIPLMPTFHPAFLLRNPASKKEVWGDLQQVMKRLGELGLLPARKA